MSEAEDKVTNDHGIEMNFPESDPNGNGYTVIFSGDWFPDPMFMYDAFGHWNRFMIVPYNSHGTYSDSSDTCQNKINEFKTHPVSAGPYKFIEWIQGDNILLERFDD
jgi:ABC-type transport system substrate-binding protein